MTEVQFYTNPMSRGRIARWMLEETGAPYAEHLLGYGAEMKSAEYRAINPMGKVPCIVHGAALVTEVAAICAYLADAFPEAGLAPERDAPERGAYYRWLFFAAGPLEAAVINKSFGFELPDDPQARGRAGWGDFSLVVDTLEGLLADGREFVLGARFSAADVYLGSQIGWGLQFGTIDARPGFKDYAARIMSRPAAIRANERDDAAMAKMQEGARG
ncbi:glutathione S-transferase family protein [Poseidonocella sedimentorum]|uniref:Glutathione S-transferase n=1 Tax=Poseidonocella sedimentorum TaxID=871652 RepID=A0A1I6CVN0_9RHOB|nr:glutathione S-transferase family protein [Poseidonocella sedimentorum]SFQ97163.1 glutathione S-transferase [Poseidonocella sedimentorum]